MKVLRVRPVEALEGRGDDLGSCGLGESLEFGQRLLERPLGVTTVDANQNRAVAAILVGVFD